MSAAADAGAAKRDSILRAGVAESARVSDWGTIDFVANADQARRNKASSSSKHVSKVRGGQMEDVRAAISSSQGWLSAILAGLLLGFIAVLVEVANGFVVNIRQGICINYFWLNKELCCPGSEGGCPGWVTWGDFFGGAGSPHGAVTSFVCYVLLGTVFAGTAALFCKSYAPFAAGGGIVEVKTIVSGSFLNRYFSAWTLGIKSIAVALSTGSGLQVGKEGPFVHIGSCCADMVGQLFPDFQDETRRRELISAGAAGGVAVAFGAPIGGVIFAVEEISSFYSFRMMMQSLMVGVTAVLVVKNFDVDHTGRIVQFSINYKHSWKWFELPLYALLGCVGGLIGCLWNKCNMAWIRRRKTTVMKQWPVTEVLILGFVSCVINFFLPFSKGGLLGLLANLYQECEEGSTLEVCNDNDLYLTFYLILTACVKVGLSIISVGSMVPAGLLVPSLAIGALYGRAFGLTFNAIQQSMPSSYIFAECNGQTLCVIPAAYAIVGSAAVLTGVTRMTVCLAVIMFELTGGLEYLVPVIVGILSAKATGDALGIDSIYELGIEANNFPFLDPKKEFHHDHTAGDIIKDKSYVMLESAGMTLSQLNNILEVHPFSGFPIINNADDTTLLGSISRQALVAALHETAVKQITHPDDITAHSRVRFKPVSDDSVESAMLDFSNYVDSAAIQVPPECSMVRLLYIFKSLGIRHVIVTRYAKFSGIVTKKDLISFMRKIEEAEEHEEAHLLGKDGHGHSHHH